MNLLASIISSKEKILLLEQNIPIKNHKKRISEIDEILSNSPNIWDNAKKTAELLKERNFLEALLNSISNIKDNSANILEYVQEFPEEINIYKNEIESIEKQVLNLELSQMFKDPIDNNPAILTISAGARRFRSC